MANPFVLYRRRKFKREFEWTGPPVKHLEDFTEAEIEALEREYGCPVKRPKKGKSKE